MIVNQVIAYELSAVENADQIVEHHFYRELLTKSGAYCRLHESWYSMIRMAKGNLGLDYRALLRRNRLGECQANWGRLELGVTNSSEPILPEVYFRKGRSYRYQDLIYLWPALSYCRSCPIWKSKGKHFGALTHDYGILFIRGVSTVAITCCKSAGQGPFQNSVLALGDGHDGAVALGQPAEVHVADQGPVLPLSGRQIGTAEGQIAPALGELVADQAEGHDPAVGSCGVGIVVEEELGALQIA